jgi:hypothetical protein
MGHFRYPVPLYDAKPLPEVEISSMGMSEMGHFDHFLCTTLNDHLGQIPEYPILDPF